jgi:hypothetical protein
MILNTLSRSCIALLFSCAALFAVPQTMAQQSTRKLAGYTVIVVEKVMVEKNSATEDFPKGMDVVLQGQLLIKLRDSKMFDRVLDGSAVVEDSAPPSSQGPGKESSPASNSEKKEGEAPAAKAEKPASTEKQIVLQSTVIQFEKGSRAARYWGSFGAGQSKVKVRYRLKDKQTNEEVLAFDKQGTFKGMLSSFGGSQDEALIKAVTGAAKALLTELAKHH